MIIQIIEKLSGKATGSNAVVYFDIKEVSHIQVANPKDPECAFITFNLKNGISRIVTRDTFEEANQVVLDLYERLKSGPHIYSIDRSGD